MPTDLFGSGTRSAEECGRCDHTEQEPDDDRAKDPSHAPRIGIQRERPPITAEDAESSGSVRLPSRSAAGTERV
jgi:hypothetical protein